MPWSKKLTPEEYAALDPKQLFRDSIWVTQDRVMMPISKMACDHLDYAIDYVHRAKNKAKKATTVTGLDKIIHNKRLWILKLKAERARRDRDGIYIPR